MDSEFYDALLILFQSHNDVLDDHKTLTMKEYQKQAGRLETRMCIEHKDQVCSLGCGVCLSVFCSSCITPHIICRSGKSIFYRSISGY